MTRTNKSSSFLFAYLSHRRSATWARVRRLRSTAEDGRAEILGARSAFPPLPVDFSICRRLTPDKYRPDTEAAESRFQLLDQLRHRRRFRDRPEQSGSFL